jgi:hypothetical protein
MRQEGVRAGSRDVVADLVAGLVILSALDGKLESRRAVARGGGDVLQIGGDGSLQGLGFGEGVDR